jgi:uncharacterized protein (DUF1778 family)
MSNDETENDPSITTLGIRIPEELRAKIREAAKLEDRTESSFARYYLSRAADVVIAEQLQPAADQ